MSQQHAEAYISDLYDFEGSSHETPSSAYARRYLRYLLGEDVGDWRKWKGGPIYPREREQIRERVERELAR